VRPIVARLLTVMLSAVAIAACTGSGGPSGAPSSAGAQSNPAPTTAAPSPTARPRLYPYVLTWPEDQLRTTWRYASVAWDGEMRIDHGNAQTDSVKTLDGDLFAFGVETTGTAADLQQRIAANATREHGCDVEPLDEAALTGGGEEGILALHSCNGERVLRWFAVHDGFGLAAFLLLAPDVDADAARSRFEAAIAALTWLD
jgi:hypothetical protein